MFPVILVIYLTHHVKTYFDIDIINSLSWNIMKKMKEDNVK